MVDIDAEINIALLHSAEYEFDPLYMQIKCRTIIGDCYILKHLMSVIIFRIVGFCNPSFMNYGSLIQQYYFTGTTHFPIVFVQSDFKWNVLTINYLRRIL